MKPQTGLLDPDARHGSRESVRNSERDRRSSRDEARASDFCEAPAAPVSPRNRIAYAMLKNAMDDAVTALYSNRSLAVTEIEGLQLKAIETIHASARATIELVEAFNVARDPSSAFAAQFEHYRRQLDAMNGQVTEFLASAQGMLAALATSAPFSEDCPQAADCAGAPCDARTIMERLKLLTPRQKRVLELVADGLPNKLIAHELGIGETTVKAHVGEVLRKLCVYNRARAIAMLAKLDMKAIMGANGIDGAIRRPRR